ncbi:MAG: DUF2076 domain-containing protein [Gammaproteobacteria bacterium]|nr:DUF2076 domain-containing protein [Gammaproteobacteria bacterium]
MTPQEQKLIQGVAQRLRNAKLTEKDAAAEDLINNEIGAQPDSTYVLTQAVILQEHALKQAQSKIEGLQKRVEQARQPRTEKSAGSSFLGGMFGGGDRQRSASPAPRPPAGTGRRGPWGGPAATAQGQAAGAAGGGFGSFMKSAAAMAVGVAGGHLLAGALQDMFSDEEGNAEQVAEEVPADDGESDFEEPLAETEEFDQEFQDPEIVDDSEAESDFDFGGDDVGGDDWG